MLLDGETQFSNRQAVTATAVSTNFIDLQEVGTRPFGNGPLRRDIGGWGIDLLVQVTQNFAGGTSIAVQMQTDDNPGFTSATTVAATPAVPVAQLVAGYRFPMSDFPVGTVERYVRLNYVVVGTMTAGTITAAVAAGVDRNV
ncbi:Bbp16 family capsid cement protein [Paracoccus shanxieyensis]|uniref:Uncharacterized protein n=1 Tax=Paracoccus shanxieyensis TaxID=2675752 RepID=A0A6L6IZM6_9RHOB|nr:hypothetical protein [Paracoccus shanxieyensis]MTH65071.1 hypothetical protein [Paracoccus shanxieyensis]MTH88215.1 hypothetical protein [Paracoccus shanxieyensis]